MPHLRTCLHVILEKDGFATDLGKYKLNFHWRDMILAHLLHLLILITYFRLLLAGLETSA